MKTLLAIEIFLIIGLLLTGCGRGTSEGAQDHGQFETYFQKFEAESIAHGRDTTGDAGIKIQFVDSLGLVTNEVGQCDKHFSAARTVSILKSAWDGYDDNMRTVVLAHELGHCLLNREHRADTFNLYIPWDLSDPYCPVSMMHATLPTGDEYKYEQDMYWDEMFSEGV